jgi:hypothetical protein
MVRPAAFGSNPETLASNAFQSGDAGGADVATLARGECDELARRLGAAGVEVIVVEDTPDPPKPDACFPNNWLSLHHDGIVVVYPMLAASRRLERRLELLTLLEMRGFAPREALDLRAWERRGAFLEGTGSLVLDHVQGIAYACRSPRTHEAPLAEFAAALGYTPYLFDATGPAGVPVYHTNVVMSIGDGFVVACLEALAEESEQQRLRDSLASGNRALIALSREQMQAFAGNLLAIATASGGRVIALSATAWASLGPAERRALERCGEIVAVPVPTIERLGGGSVRCMLAEVFLPRAAA